MTVETVKKAGGLSVSLGAVALGVALIGDSIVNASDPSGMAFGVAFGVIAIGLGLVFAADVLDRDDETDESETNEVELSDGEEVTVSA